MKNWRQFLQKYWQVVVVVIAIVTLLIITSVLNSNERLAGSTYGREPNGYGAWYQMMADRETPIKRWRQSTKELARQYPSGTSLLQVNSEIKDFSLSTAEKEWISKGNTWIILGVDAPAQDIAFSQDLRSPLGAVQIETTRRLESAVLPGTTIPIDKIVGDTEGNVVASAKIGIGRVIVSTTPYLAANAYQDSLPNYELLASLATTDRQRIFVDEYLHGYRDPVVTTSGSGAANTPRDEWSYLLKTPFLVALTNLGLVFGIVTWRQNRRFGAVIIPQPPVVDNSLAYIQALGGVLRQAKSSDFVVQNIGKAEQLSLQQQLGLGNQQLVDHQTLLLAWQAHTKMPADDLQQVLQLATDQRLTESELRQWLLQLQAVRDQLQRQSP
jgi:Domain of unknown function (DUF4350)